MNDVEILFVVIFLLVGVFALGPLPGYIAKKRRHPAVDAINICAFMGIFTFGVLWIIAFIWAHSVPVVRAGDRPVPGVEPVDPIPPPPRREVPPVVQVMACPACGAMMKGKGGLEVRAGDRVECPACRMPFRAGAEGPRSRLEAAPTKMQEGG